MTVGETGQVMDLLTVAYPRFYAGMDEEKNKSAVRLWATMFADEPFPVVLAAVKAFIAADTEGYPPVIGKIKERVRQVTEPEGMTPQEAWNKVWKAIQNGGYSSRSEWERLPEEVQRCVTPEQIHTWALMDAREVQTVIGSVWQKGFAERRRMDREFSVMPGDVKRIMAAVKLGEIPAAEFKTLDERRADTLKRLEGA